MIALLLILLAILTIFIAFLIFQSLGGKLVGAEIEEIAIFNGPALFGFEVGGIKFRLNLLPLGSYVKFADSFENLAAVKKILVVLAGFVSYLVVAFIGLGFDEAFSQVWSGFGQILRGVFSPVAVGSNLIGSLANVFSERSFITGTAILASKFLALNLLPVGTLGGGALFLYLLELFGFKSKKFSETFQLIGLFVLLVIILAWLISFGAFAWKVFRV